MRTCTRPGRTMALRSRANMTRPRKAIPGTRMNVTRTRMTAISAPITGRLPAASRQQIALALALPVRVALRLHGPGRVC